MARASRFWVFWIRNTMRKVTIVVPVLITSCHVSEKPKIGPEIAHATMTNAAPINAHELPDHWATRVAPAANHACIVTLISDMDGVSKHTGRDETRSWRVCATRPSQQRSRGDLRNVGWIQAPARCVAIGCQISLALRPGASTLQVYVFLFG